MDQFLRFSIRDDVLRMVESSFWVGVVGVKIAGELVQEDSPVGADREYGQTGFVWTAGTTLLLFSLGGVSFNISCILVRSKLVEVLIWAIS